MPEMRTKGMNYDLVKELKEADFPFKRLDGSWIHNTPNLTELIEACGENIKEIIFLHDQNLIRANSQDSFGVYGQCITIKEAIANLWLALNEKKEN